MMEVNIRGFRIEMSESVIGELALEKLRQKEKQSSNKTTVQISGKKLASSLAKYSKRTTNSTCHHLREND